MYDVGFFSSYIWEDIKQQLWKDSFFTIISIRYKLQTQLNTSYTNIR